MREQISCQILAQVLDNEDIDWLSSHGCDTINDAAAIVEEFARRGKDPAWITAWMNTPSYKHGGRTPLINIGTGYAHELTKTTNSRRKGQS